jgi:hypothetical protein
MRKRLFYILRVVLMALLLPLTVFAEGRIRSADITVQDGGDLYMEVRLSGIDNRSDGLTADPYIVEVTANATVEGNCVNQDGHVPNGHGYWIVDFMQVDPHFGDLRNEEAIIFLFDTLAYDFQDMCPEDLVAEVTSHAWTGGTISLFRFNDGVYDGVDIINYSIS